MHINIWFIEFSFSIDEVPDYPCTSDNQYKHRISVPKRCSWNRVQVLINKYQLFKFISQASQNTGENLFFCPMILVHHVLPVQLRKRSQQIFIFKWDKLEENGQLANEILIYLVTLWQVKTGFFLQWSKLCLNYLL